MPIMQKYGELGEMVARDYIKGFLKDVRKWSPEGIDYMRHLECLAGFHRTLVKTEKMDFFHIVQGENEINLAVNLYNILNSEYGKN